MNATCERGATRLRFDIRELALFVGVAVMAAGLNGRGSATALTMISPMRVNVAEGVLEGVETDGIRSFKGVPFASPPVGPLRWKAPQPARGWVGVRKATDFGPRCLQDNAGLVFRSADASEDCLYLNVWTPTDKSGARLPVLVYIFGGGFGLGDGSEPRHDGAALARKGIVTVTFNYRLSMFGFLAHPALTAESLYHGSGNYGLLDQTAALQWVRRNIAAFGGDPARVTIAGNSAGAASVSALMVSPLSRDLIFAVIGSAGALIPPAWGAVPLRDAEQVGVTFAEATGARALSDLREIPAAELMNRMARPPYFRFTPVVDGYFLTKTPAEAFARGEQANVPLLVGWTSHEQPSSRPILGTDPPTPSAFAAALQRLYGEQKDEVLRAYPATTPEEIAEAASNLASDRWLVYSTWKWAELHGKSPQHVVYRYVFMHQPPSCESDGRRVPRHGDDMDYALGNARAITCGVWRSQDEQVSQLLQKAFVRFVSTGNPNGRGLPKWPPANATTSNVQVLYLAPNSRVDVDRHRQRYLLLDSIYDNK